MPSIGIVTASKLICRKEPTINSEKVGLYNFSNPVMLIDKTIDKAVVNGIEDYWHQDKETKGWLFGGYLLITKTAESSFRKMKAERIWCNVICGGFSCFYNFEPYIVGDYFIAYVYLNDYPQENEPFAGIIIGDFKKSDNELIFNNVIKIGGYYENGEWIDDVSRNSDSYNMFKAYDKKFVKVNDEEGEYFVSEQNANINNRKYYRDLCNDKSNNEEIWYTACTLNKVSIEECRKIIQMEKFRIK